MLSVVAKGRLVPRSKARPAEKTETGLIGLLGSRAELD
jgi:hypothetical protein